MAEDLPLEDLIGLEHLAHYQRFLGQARIKVYVHPASDQGWSWTATQVPDDAPAPDRYGMLREAERRKPADELLIRNGYGPDECSTSQELDITPQWSWDVCGYYRRLGLHWRATRKEIRHALIERGATVGAGKADLIYAASQLLNEEVRRSYDRTPLGCLFLRDKDTEEMLKREAQQQASAMAARGFTMTPEDVLGSWGLRATPRSGSEGEGREPEAPRAPVPPPPGPAVPRWGVQWSWYSDPESRYLLAYRRIGELEHWQQLLVSAFAARGIRARFAVGLCMTERFLIRPAPNQGTVVILLGRGEPTPEMAAEAADMWWARPGDTELRSQGDR